MASSQTNYGNESCKIFVGRIPKDAGDDEIKDAFQRWGGVVAVYIGQTGHVFRWATVEFTCTRRRDEFLNKEKHKHRFQNAVLDVKKFSKLKPEAAALQAAQTAQNGNAVVIPKAPLPSPTAPLPPQAASLPPPPQRPKFQTAVIKNYKGRDFGTLRADGDIGNGIFNVRVVFLCSVHQLQCRVPNCVHYKRFDPADNTRQHPIFALKMNTQVAVKFRLLKNTGMAEEYGFQATAVWPQQSLPPPDVDRNAPSEVDLDVQLIEFTESVDAKAPLKAPPKEPPMPFPKAPLKEPLNGLFSVPPPTFIPPPKAPPKKAEDEQASENASFASSSEDKSNYADEYLESLEKIIDFLKGQLKQYDGRSAKDLGVYRLATNIMKIKGPIKDKENQGALLICKFIKEKNIDVPEKKLTGFISHFRVLMHNVFFGKKEIDADEALALIKSKTSQKKAPASSYNDDVAVNPVINFNPTASDGDVIESVQVDFNHRDFEPMSDWLTSAYAKTQPVFACSAQLMAQSVIEAEEAFRLLGPRSRKGLGVSKRRADRRRGFRRQGDFPLLLATPHAKGGIPTSVQSRSSQRVQQAHAQYSLQRQRDVL